MGRVPAAPIWFGAPTSSTPVRQQSRPGLGTALWLGFFTPFGGLGIWIGLAVGLVVVALLMLQRWSRRARLGLLPI